MDDLDYGNTHNIVTYYILPLLKFNYKTFGHYYMTTELFPSLDGIKLKLMSGCREEFWKHDNYEVDYSVENETHAIFSIPREFKDDVVLISQGKYSKISDRAKLMIKNHSGLMYKSKIDNVIVSDKLLMVLDKDPILKQWIEKEAKVRVGKEVELYYLPETENIYVRDE